jgi:quercetin dioxygenase-like cupin family protein
MRKLMATTTGAVVLAGVLAASTAVAAPGGGSAAPTPPPPAPSAGPVVEGTLDGGTRAQQDGILLRTRRDATVRTFTLTYPAGAESGWHQHPGVVLATVESGEVVQRVGCDRNTWEKGQSFTEVEPHLIINPSATEPAVLRITQIVPVGATLRENVDPPRCRHRR